MAKVRFLDQVPVGVFQTDPTGVGNGTIDIYQNGVLVSSSVPFINISGSATVSGFSVSGSDTGVTIFITGSGGGSGNGFPFSGSAVITGSLVISGSIQPIIIQTLPYEASPSYVITYNTSFCCKVLFIKIP